MQVKVGRRLLVDLAQKAVTCTALSGAKREAVVVFGLETHRGKNLVNNAWKFSARRQNAAIEFAYQKGPGGEIIHFVRDNGVGFWASLTGTVAAYGPNPRPGQGASF